MTTGGRWRAGAVAFGLSLCVAGGCTVERVTAVALIAGSTVDDAGMSSDAGMSETSMEGDADASSSNGDGATRIDGGSGDGFDALTCTDPYVITDPTNGQWPPGGLPDDAGYFVRNGVWNTEAGPGPQTLYVCSPSSWDVTSTQSDDGGEVVKSYPNVQMDFNDTPISSLSFLSSSFAETSPHVGSYEVEYDIWLNGFEPPNSNQVMVWVDRYGRTAPGMHVGTETFGEQTYDVWSNGSSTAFVATQAFTSGTVNLLQILENAGLPASSTLSQVGFGVEIVSTEGMPETFDFDAFSITAM